MPHVFISHVRNNKRKVQRLCEELIQHGVEVWLDRNKIRGGSLWQEAIEEAIQEGAFFLACFSKQYNERDETYMNEELTLAIERLRRLPYNRNWFIPVLLNKCEVPSWSIGAGGTPRSINWVELYKDWDSGIKEILDVIQPTRISELMEELKSPFARVRIDAAHELGQMSGFNRDKDIVRALIKALDDENETVVANAVYALSEFGESTMIDVVYALLRLRNSSTSSSFVDRTDSMDLLPVSDLTRPSALEPYVDRIANIALTRICNIGEPAISILIYALRDPSVRYAAADVLGLIGNTSAITGLIGALEDKDVEVRKSAVCGLRDAKDTSAVTALIGALEDKDKSVREITAYALMQIGTPEGLKAVEEYEKQKERDDFVHSSH